MSSASGVLWAAFATLTLFFQVFVTSVCCLGICPSFLCFFPPLYSHFYFIFFLFTWNSFLLPFSVSLQPKKIFFVSYFSHLKKSLFRTYLILVQVGYVDFLTLCNLIKVCFLNIHLLKITSVFSNITYFLKEIVELYSFLYIDRLTPSYIFSFCRICSWTAL